MSPADDSLRPEEFADAARAAIADAQGRTLRDTADVLAQAGLLGVCAAEGEGGLGLSIAFAVPIARAAGQMQLRFPLVEQMLLARHLTGTPWAQPLAKGSRLATVAWQGNLAEGLAGPVQMAEACDWALVPEPTPHGLGAALIDLQDVGVQDDAALDPEHPQQWLRLSLPSVLARLPATAYAAFVADAQLLHAALAHGAAEAALRAAVSHLSTRVQFGRPLSAKQAVRHHLARMKLAQEVTGAAIERALRTDEFGLSRSPRSTLAGALQQSASVIEKAMHLHGGMGFTWDLPLHQALREVRKLDAAWGAGALARELGQAFIAQA